MDPTAPNSGDHAAAASPTNTTVTLPPLTLRRAPPPHRRGGGLHPDPQPHLPPPLLPPVLHLLHLPGERLPPPRLLRPRLRNSGATRRLPPRGPAWGPRRRPGPGPRRARHLRGLCPGLNTVLRELVVGLQELYGVRDVFGVAAGYRGFYGADVDHVRLDPTAVDDWHKKGGTVLKTTRGGFNLNKIVDGIVARGYTQATLGTSMLIPHAHRSSTHRQQHLHHCQLSISPLAHPMLAKQM